MSEYTNDDESKPVIQPPAYEPKRRYTEAEKDGKPLFGFFALGQDLFIMYLKNYFLILITLGIYSFWAKVNVRKYLWSKTYFLGEPLEYTGTGKELFLSFLIVMPIFGLVFFLFGFVIEAVPFLGFALFWLSLVFLTRFAVYRTIRYRLTRTKWRGIHGNLVGDSLRYTFIAGLYDLLTVVTLGFCAPLAIAKTTDLLVNNIYLGDRKISFTGTASPLYRAYFTYIAAVLGIFVLFGIATHGLFSDINHTNADTRTALFMLLYLCTLAAIYLGSSYVSALTERWFYNNISWGNMWWKSNLDWMELLRLRFTNMLLICLTWGIGYAWAQVREYTLRFGATGYVGDPELDLLLQDAHDVPKRGEGLLEALEIDLAM